MPSTEHRDDPAVRVIFAALRAKDPQAERPFRTPLYPFTPIVFCTACAWLAWSSITYAASRDAVHVSLLVMAIGVVAWAATRWHARARAGAD